MGFLGFGNFSKPGPGVDKDEPQKAALVRYFEILGRKFWKLVQANLLFASPVLLTFILVMILLSQLPWQSYLFIYIGLLFLIPIYPLFAGLTKITRNFVREEHAFIWSDFIRTAKSNYKLFLMNGFVCYAAFVVLSVAISYYFTNMGNNPFFFIPLVMCLMVSVILIFAQYYLPIILITFDLNYRQAFKNAMILGVLGMGRNILLTLGTAVFLVGLFLLASYLLTLPIAFLLIFLIVFSLYSYTVNFAVYPLIQKYMLDPKPKEEPKKADEKAMEQEASKHYWDELQGKVKDEDAWVYVNGRMMKKTDYKGMDEH